MTARVTRVTSDSAEGGGAWEVKVSRAAFVSSDYDAHAHDVPADVLLALREWLDEAAP